MADDRKTHWFWMPKGNNSSIAQEILTKLHVHNHIMVIYTPYKFHEIQSIAY